VIERQQRLHKQVETSLSQRQAASGREGKHMILRGRPTRQAFTMVELLVVIVIIAILASLLVVGMRSALIAANKARIRAEMMGLAAAFERYQSLHNDLPPSDDQQEFILHMNRLFARRDRTEVIPEMDQAELIYFYLTGYSGNERYPVYYGNDPNTGTVGLINADNRESLFDFDPKRLYDHDNDGIPWYIPQGAPGKIPYVYFKKRPVQRTMSTPSGGTRNERMYEWFGPPRFAENAQETQAFRYENLTFANPDEQPPDFGNAVPWYYEDPEDDSDNQIAPRQGKDFQIVCAGLEERYSHDTNLTSLKDGTEDD
jgi:prepilin-type N-terminal cleavage/methylation domain-containing protein